MNDLIERVRLLRQRQTEAEKVFWERVRNKKTGYKFKRQKLLSIYTGNKLRFFIADFFCQELHLVVELDGKIHENQIERDRTRDSIINMMNYRVIRIKNDEILKNLELILNDILPSPSLERVAQ